MKQLFNQFYSRKGGCSVFIVFSVLILCMIILLGESFL